MPRLHPKFTKRQRELRDMLVTGASMRQIAKKIGLSARTVEAHRNTILEKYRVNTRIDLVRVVYRVDELRMPKYDPE